jgi:hypothetical protein
MPASSPITKRRKKAKTVQMVQCTAAEPIDVMTLTKKTHVVSVLCLKGEL